MLAEVRPYLNDCCYHNAAEIQNKMLLEVASHIICTLLELIAVIQPSVSFMVNEYCSEEQSILENLLSTSNILLRAPHLAPLHTRLLFYQDFKYRGKPTVPI